MKAKAWLIESEPRIGELCEEQEEEREEIQKEKGEEKGQEGEEDSWSRRWI